MFNDFIINPAEQRVEVESEGGCGRRNNVRRIGRFCLYLGLPRVTESMSDGVDGWRETLSSFNFLIHIQDCESSVKM